ncbi:MAG: response regulator [Endomicrobiales bacterium]
MPRKILIADDEDEIIELVRATLEPAGYTVVSTGHGNRLPGLIGSEKPDLLLLDVLLPGLDGYSLQLQLAQNEETSTLPVIVITALPASRSLFEKFEQVKCFLDKPFDTSELLRKVKEIVGE